MIDIGCVCYNKINQNNQSILLVYEKLGLLLVNSNSLDVLFNYDLNGEPGRQFLIEENLELDKTKITILKCNLEKEAYEKENIYINTLGLFNS